MIGALAACAPAQLPTPTPSATPIVLPTLPPTWTPTPSFTPVSPLPTFTPTPTPTLAPTLAAASLCESFYTDTNLNRRRIFARDMHITLLAQSPAPDVTIRFMAVHHVTGANKGVDMPGGGMTGFQLPVRQLPGTGRYDWTIRIVSPVYGEICEREGWFLVARLESTRAEEAEVR
ncbi:MAG: hypothetical protein HZC41_21610 [Chloroflexi bacterium]|nr:hypothetical protein [Chloroflexota bacterium]